MVREYAPRANALSLTSAPAFSTDGSFDVGVWNGHKYDTLEGYMATDRSATVTIYQTDVSGRWDWSKTIYGNNAGSSVVVVDVAASLKADLVRIVIQGTSGDTPTQSGFRLVTKGKIAGQDDVNISGQAVKTWMSGAVTVLNSGPVPVNMSGQVIKVWESGAVTVLASGPVPINPGVYAFNISGAPTVLVSGPLVVKISGETINIAAVSISNVTVEISGDPVQVGNFPDATSGGPRSLRVEASGELVVRFSGEVVKVWESGAVTVLQSGAVTTLVSGPLPVNVSGQEIKAWLSGAVTVLQSGAITVLTSGPVPVNISGQEIKTWVSGAVTVLQSGAVTVLTSGPVPVNLSGQITNISGNTLVNLLASAIRSGNTATSDQVNHNGKGIALMMHITGQDVSTTPQITMHVYAKDTGAGDYQWAKTVPFAPDSGDHVLLVYPGAAAAVSGAHGTTIKGVVPLPVPRSWYGYIQHNQHVTSLTYTLDASTLL